jgi:hypothetical protein
VATAAQILAHERLVLGRIAVGLRAAVATGRLSPAAARNHYERALHALHLDRKARRPPVYRPPPDDSGSELRGILQSKVGKAVENVIPFGSEIAGVVEALAPILDSSLANVGCVPGNPRWPACAIPGGSKEALVQSGLSEAQADAVISSVVTSGSMPGQARQSDITVARNLKEE